MVAERGRMTALWIAALMLVTILPATAPTAVAAHGSQTSDKFYILTGTQSIEYDGRTLASGMEIVANWTVTGVSGACPTGINNVYGFGSATVDGTILGGTATDPATGTATGANLNISYRRIISATNQMLSAAKLTATVTYTCTGGLSGTPHNQPFTTQSSFVLDSFPPSLTADFTPSHLATREPIGGVDAKVGALGTTLNFVLASNGTSLLWDKSALDGSAAGFVALPTPPSIQVKSPADGWPEHEDRTRAVKFRAVDNVGNVREVELNILIDNMPPTVSAQPSGAATLVRSQVRGAPFSAEEQRNSVSIPWTTASGVAYAKISVRDNTSGTPLDPPVAVGFGSSLGSTFRFDVVPGGSQNLDMPLAFTISPVDAAGNGPTAANLAGLTRSVTFPSMATRYGVGQTSAVALSNISNIVIEATGGPTPSWPIAESDADPGVLWAELSRRTTEGGLEYFVVGSDTEFGPSQPAPNQEGTTAIRPSGTVSAPAGSATVTLPQLASTTTSGTRFEDGSYYITVNFKGANNNKLQHVLRFVIDGQAPRFEQPLPYADNGTDVAPTFREVHGMDGNPFWAVVHANDLAGEEGTGGLRNVTVELIDAHTKTVARLSNGTLARFDLRPANPESDSSCLTNKNDAPTALLPYCLDLDAYGTPSECATLPLTLWCAFRSNLANTEVPDEEKYNTTIIDSHTFRGWVNKTLAGLPVGRYTIRTIVNDVAGAQATKLIPTAGSADRYVVAPAVKVFTNATLPSLDASGNLNVIALASEYSQNTDNRLICRSPPGNELCAPDTVEIYVSTSATGAGTLAATLRGASAQWLGDTETVMGYGGTAEANGTLFHSKAVPLSFYRYTDTITAATLADLGITGSTLFVRAVAVSNDTAGAIVNRATDWIPVSRPGDAALTIRLPAEAGALYLTSETANPAINITFDGKNKATVPVMRLWINKSSSATDTAFSTPVASHDLLGADRVNNIEPQYVANWSGPLPGARLTAGRYQIDVQMFENRTTEVGCPGGATSCVVRDIVANKTRTFVVLTEKPSISVGTLAATSNLAPVPTDPNRYYSKSSLTLPIRIDHGAIPTPDVSLLNFTLKPSTGAVTTLYPGQSGFTVSTQQTGATTGGITPFNLNVNLPLDAVHAGIYTLITRLDLAAPAHVGNPQNITTFVLDKAAPFGALLPIDSENTMITRGPTTQPWYDLASPFPTLVGYAQDNQSGVGSVEVRIVDLTTGQTIRLDKEGIVNGTTVNDGYTVINSIGDFWTTSAPFKVNGTGPDRRLVHVSPPSNDPTNTRVVTWHLPLNRTTDGALDARFWRPADLPNASGWIDYTHQYRIDVRARDNLGILSDTYSTLFDFDGAPPFLALNTTADVPSGILTTKNRVNWRSEADNVVLTVRATDNNCLKSVRIYGNTSITQTPVWANMTAKEYVLANGSTVSIPDGAAVCPRGRQVNYELNLRNAPQLANDVGEYTYWVQAEDTQGQIVATPANLRFFKMEVIDITPARVIQALMDPNPGQNGGRALIRALVSDNTRISHVTIEMRNDTTNALIANGTMRPENVTALGVGWWIADTTDDLNTTLVTGGYNFNITAFDVNWNRSVDDGGPTCPIFCLGHQPHYNVRDDGAPTVQLVSPATGSSVGTSPTITMRAQHKAITAAQIVVRVSADGTEANLTPVPAAELNLTELLASNGSRQGWTVVYKPTNLSDNQTILVNFTASIPGLTAAASYTFTVDASAPTVNATASNLVPLAGKEWGTRATRVAISATDGAAGALTLLYSVNGAPQQTYTAEIDPAGDGEWRLEYWATDASGNSAARKTLNFTLDERAPNVSRIAVSDPDEVLVNAVDTGIGLNESTVIVHYRYATTGAYSTQKADKVSGSSFRATLPGDANATGLQYYITAADLLGNEGTNFTQASPYTIAPDGGGEEENLPPTITISAPLPDAIVNGTVTIRWLAEDPEQGQLTVSIAIKSPNPRILVTGGENTGSYALNLAGAPGGSYTVVVTVSDGKQSVNSEVTFTVRGEVITVPVPPPTSVTAGTPVSVALVISPVGKTIETATFRVLKDGAAFLTGTLTPVQGRYIAQFTPTEPGAYTVFADVSYTDDSVEPAKQVAAFTVPGTTTPPDEGEGKVVPTSIIALAALAVLTIAGAAYGAFGRWKK